MTKSWPHKTLLDDRFGVHRRPALGRLPRQASGFCSFPDGLCPSGSRYAEYAGDGLAGACVDDSGESSASTDDGAATGTPSTTGADDTGSNATTSTTSTGTDATLGDASTGDTDAPNAAVVTFGERLDADHQGVTQDTFITAVPLFQGDNAGAHEDLHICGGTATAPVSLMRFDLEALAPGTVVASAEIELYPLPGNSGVDVFDTFVMLESWDEGVADLTPGVANYIDREPSVPWSAPGAGPPSREAVSLGQTNPTNTPGVPFSVTIPASAVQAWIDEPSTNFGIAMTALDPSCNAVFLSADYAEAARRPLLRVTLDEASRD